MTSTQSQRVRPWLLRVTLREREEGPVLPRHPTFVQREAQPRHGGMFRAYRTTGRRGDVSVLADRGS